MTRPALAGLTIRVQVLEGRNFIAKDRNLLGKRTTSDPYVKVYSEVNGKYHQIGKTKVVRKTLSPVWKNAETFNLTLGADSARSFLNHNGGINVVLHIFDHDVGEDDFMGAVEIKLHPLNVPRDAKWYSVQKRSAGLHCHNARGEMRVKVDMTANQMRDLGTGQATVLSSHNRVKVGLAWDMERQYGGVAASAVDLDCSCVALDRNGNVLMDQTVYYGNLQNPNHSIYHSGDETTGEAEGDDEKIFLELGRIPSHVLALYFVLTVATPGKTFGQVKSAKARLVDTASRNGLCRIVPHELGNDCTALIMMRLSRHASGGWIVSPINRGFLNARDYGSLIPEIKSFTRDLIPGLQVNPNERIAVMRKGGTIRVADYLPPGAVPDNLCFGLAWDVTKGVNIDLDASAILLDQNLQMVDLVYFSHLISNDGAIRHSGDEREGDEEGDDEKISVSLGTVSPNIKYIGFVINSYSRQELDDVDRAACHLFDSATGTDIATYTLTNSKELDKHTALLLGCLYRNEGAWYLTIISEPKQGTMAKDNVGDLVRFLQMHPPEPPSAPPPQEAEIDLSIPVAQIEEEAEIDLTVPASDFSHYVEEEIDLTRPPK